MDLYDLHIKRDTLTSPESFVSAGLADRNILA